MPSVSAHVAAVAAHHADHVFGVMGNGNAYFLDAIERAPDIDYCAMRHEAGGVVAADAYHRASGRVGVATATYGAGFTNTLTPLAESAQARVSMLVVVGDAPSSGARPWDVDQRAIADALGVPTYTVGISDAAEVTRRAIADATVLRRPVVVAIPYDISAADAGPLPLFDGDSSARRDDSTPSGIAQVADALTHAQRPFLLAGRGAWLAGAAGALGALADATGAVTASSALGRGIFPHAEYDLGVAGGFGAEAAMELVHEADVAVVFGASLNQFTMRFGDLFAPGTRVFQIDVAETATNPRVDGYVRGDAAKVAAKLAEEVSARREPSDWREHVDTAALRRYDESAELAADGKLDPRAAAARIAQLLPEDRVVVSDGGHFIGWANMYWPIASPDRMMMVGTAFQSIGLGIPSMVGAAHAHPASTVVLTSGDGGGLMALADLESAVRVCGGRGLAVIWNDSAYSAEVTLYGAKGLATAPMLIPDIDFAAFARAAGGEGVIVRRVADLDRLENWRDADPETRPFLLLDLRVSGTIVAPYQEEIIRVNS